MSSFRFELNGKTVSVDAPAEMPLLWVLRDILQLTGTKYGCGIAQCGACTVHLDGQPARSCQLPIQSVADKTVTTVEGLAHNGELHPVQRAWIEEQVPQCGYCQSGQLMSAAALLARTPAPSAAEIDAALAGNLCRCGTYVRVRRAVKRASDQLAERREPASSDASPDAGASVDGAADGASPVER